MPSAGHLVHMPAHIYARVGDRHGGKAAAKQDSRQDEESPRRDPFGQFFPQSDQFLGCGPSQQIHLNELHLPLAGTTTAVELKEHRRDQGQVELEGYSLGRFGKEVPTTQNAFDPAEK